MTKIRHIDSNPLEVIGSALQRHYVYSEDKESEEMSCNSAETNRLSNMTDKFNCIYKLHSENIYFDKGDSEGKETSADMTKIESDVNTESNYIKRLYVKTVPETSLTRAGSDAVTKLDYRDVSDTNSNLNTKSSMATIKLEALTNPDYSDYLSDISDMETNGQTIQIELAAMAKWDYNNCLNVKSDVKTNSNVTLTESGYVDSLGANSDLVTNYKTKIELNAMTTPEYTDYWDAKSDVETNSFITKTKLDYGICLDANSDVERNNYTTRTESDSLIKLDYTIVWILIEVWRQAAIWWETNRCNDKNNL